jgi:hypothetical protein
MSPTSGTPPVEEESNHCVPNSVLLDVRWTYGRVGVELDFRGSGMRVYLPAASVVAATRVWPTIFASSSAFSLHPPVRM